MRIIKVGTRRSALAMQQTGMVIADLQKISAEQGIDVQFEVVPIVTKGDRILDVSLAKVGGKGLFVKEIEQALLDGEVDLAVHSMKDMPAVQPDGLTIAAVPRRVDERDALISRTGCSLLELPEGATVGTSSLRRSVQLLAVRPDLKIVPLRGNIDSRLKKVADGGANSETSDTLGPETGTPESETKLDAIVLAAAGLIRMGWQHKISEYLSTDVCLPAVAQGALALQCRDTFSSNVPVSSNKSAIDADLSILLHLYEHTESRNRIDAERSFLQTLQGDCQTPIAAYAQLLEDGQILLRGLVSSVDGATMVRYEKVGAVATTLGREVAAHILEMGI